MNSSLRVERRLRAASVVLLGVVVVFFVLPSWITLNRWIPSLSEKFHQATGRSLSIGEIKVSFWRGPELQFFQVEIGGNQKEEKPLASVAEMRIGFQLLPLLWRQWVIREIHLVDPLFLLSRDPEGEWNFEDLIRDGREKPGRWKVSNQASEIRITRGEVGLIDRTVEKGPVRWTAKEIDASASRFWLGREIRLTINVASVWRGEDPGKAAGFGVTGVINGERGALNLKKGRADLTVTLTGFDSELVRPYLRSEAIPPFIFKTGVFHLQANSADLIRTHRLFRSPDFRLEGTTNDGLVFWFPGVAPVEVNRAEWRYHDHRGTLTLKEVALMTSTLDALVFELPSGKAEWSFETSGRIALPDLAAVLASEKFDIDPLKRIKPKGTLEVAVAARIPFDSDEIELKGRVALKEGEFIPVASMKPVRKVEGEARFEQSLLEIESFRGEWGGAPFEITGRMPHVLKKGVEFDFEAPFLDLGSLFLPSDALPKKKGEPPVPRQKGEAEKPPAGERRGYWVGRVRIDHLKVGGFDLKGYQSAVTYEERALQLRDVEARVAGGSLNVNFAQAYFREDGTISLALTPNVSDVNFEEALKDFHQNGDRPFMSGKFLMVGGVDTKGRNLEEFKENLRGNLIVYFEKGTLYRFKTLGRIFTLMNLRRLPDLNEKGLPYRVISGKLSIDQGEVTLHDAVIVGRDVRMIAKGTIDLPDERLDLEMGVQVFKLLDEVIQEIPIGSQLILGKDKMFIAAYFDVEGTIDDPEVKFRPLKSIKKSVLSILERILKFPFKPRLFAKEES